LTRHVVIGTAGHIDHGKTALVGALTGVDTDRLKEEKERGISIELGFARLDLPDGTTAGVVDVPGHERFVRQMLAGAAGIDLVLLVVAADEGVMPQTVEHLEIVDLLGVERGVVALTKADLVEEELLALVREDVEELLAGTGLAGSPMIAVSAVTGRGVDEVRTALADAAQRCEARSARGPARLPIDRVFTMEGFGTVVTGTLWSGSVAAGDKLVILPSGREAQVRGVQIHGEKIERAEAGQRTAVSLRGVPKEDVDRGEVLVTPGSFVASFMIDARFRLLQTAKRALANRTRIRFHLGTREALGRVVILDREELEPGAEALVQFRLEEEVVVGRGDRFVLRSYSPIRAIGGGVVIDPQPGKHKRFKDDVIERIGRLEEGTLGDSVVGLVRESGLKGANEHELRVALSASAEEIQAELAEGVESGALVGPHRGRHFHADHWEDLLDRIPDLVGEAETETPLRWGLTRSALKVALGGKKVDDSLLDAALSKLAAAGAVHPRGEWLRASSAEWSPPADRAAHVESLLAAFTQGGLAGAPAADGSDGPAHGLTRDECRQLLETLLERGDLEKVSATLIVAAPAMNDLRERVAAFFESSEEMSVGDFKDLAGVTRKQGVPLLEHFDRTGVTARRGDVRVKGAR
jgi:selenocysteine-specific elongation factor